MLLRKAAAGLVPVVTTERSRTESGIIGAKLVRQVEATKARPAQIRPALAGTEIGLDSPHEWDMMLYTSSIIDICPPLG